MGKKNPYKFTIGFDKADPAHVYVAELLNRTNKKARLIVEAILTYEGGESGQPEKVLRPDDVQLRSLIRKLIQDEIQKARGRESAPVVQEDQSIEMDLSEEEPLAVDEDLLKNVTDAIRSFRNF